MGGILRVPRADYNLSAVKMEAVYVSETSAKI
jgi:hypothetical protein